MSAVRNTAARTRDSAARREAPLPTFVQLLGRVYQPGVLFPAAFTIALIVTWPYLPAWAPDLSNDPAYQLTADRLKLPAGHEWIPDELAGGVLERAGGEGRLSLLTDRLAERIAGSLRSEPWVKDVPEVRQCRDGTIRVDLEYRRPVLMVSTSRGMYAVDGEGVLLPPDDFDAADVARFPIARTTGALPHVPAGRKWNDPAVAGAAVLAAFLAPRAEAADPWRTLGLKEIVLPGGDGGAGRPSYELVTAGGSRILWGHAPDGESLEPSPETKLARLNYYREKCGGFETQGPARIDIRAVDVIYAGALTEQRR